MVVYSDKAIALNRFGLGARPATWLDADPRRWLLQQFERYDSNPSVLAAIPDGTEVYGGYVAIRRAAEASRAIFGGMVGGGLSGLGESGSGSDDTAEAAGAKTRCLSRTTRFMAAGAMCTLLGNNSFRTGEDVGEAARKLYRNAVEARTASALTSETPFIERMVHFWSNHFCVSVDSVPVLAFAGAFERDAIRPHVLGRFEDMLLAVEQHPAMLIYLNQNISVGPNSAVAVRRKQSGRKALGLNENLAREILELHTLGVRTGYSQADVTELARTITGWNVGPIGVQGTQGFVFKAQSHEPGARTIRGLRYAAGGIAQGEAALRDLAMAEATARHIATKLAVHFAGDKPPQVLVDRLAAAFGKTGGDLAALYRVLIDSPEAWVPQPVKLKSPWEWLVSVLRGVGAMQVDGLDVSALLQQLGQQVWKPGSPAGWDDQATAWLSPDMLFRRAQVVQQLVGKGAAELDGQGLDVQGLGDVLLPGAISMETAAEIRDAPDRTSVLSLVTMSPEFLRR